MTNLSFTQLVACITAIATLNVCYVSSAALSPSADGIEVGNIYRTKLAAIAEDFYNKWSQPVPICQPLQNLVDLAQSIGLIVPVINLTCNVPETTFYELEGLIPNLTLKGQLGIVRSSVASSFDDKMVSATGSLIWYNDSTPLDMKWVQKIPSVGIEVDYEMKDVLFYLGGLIPIPLEGRGKMRVSLEQFEIDISTKLLVEEPPKINGTDFQITSYLYKPMIKLTGVLNDASISETISKAVSDIIFKTVTKDVIEVLINAVVASDLGRPIFISSTEDLLKSLNWTSKAALEQDILLG